MKRLKEFTSYFATFLSILVFIEFFISVASAQHLELPATGVWNGFQQHINIVECNSLSADDVRYVLTLKNNTGNVLASVDFNLAAQGTVNIILNDHALLADKIGTFVIAPLTLSTPDEALRLSCATLIYRWATLGAPKAVEYAFAIPVRNPIRGSVSGIFNSYNPEAGGPPVYNWLSVVNTSEALFSAVVNNYEGLQGSFSFAKSFVISNLHPGERRDFALGHESGYSVGVYQIVPVDSLLEYTAFLTRYSRSSFGGFNFALTLFPQQGSCTPGAVPISTFDPATNWTELANVSFSPVVTDISVADQVSNTLYETTIEIPPMSQQHFYMNQYLGPRNLGSFRASCEDENDPGQLIVQSMFYGRLNDAASVIEWSYGSQARQALLGVGDKVVSPINTYLGMVNWNKVLDLSGSRSEVLLTVNEPSGLVLAQQQQTLLPNGTIDLGLHQYAGANAVGQAEIKPMQGSLACAAELIRVFPHAWGSIGYIMNLQSTAVERLQRYKMDITASDPLISWDGSSPQFTVTAQLSGTILGQDSRLLIDQGSAMGVDTGALWGVANVRYDERMTRRRNWRPTSGSFVVEVAGDRIFSSVNNATLGYEISVDRDADGSIDEGPAVLSWDEFEDIELGNTATPEYQRQAALGDDVGGFLAAEMLPIIVGLIDDIVAYAGIIEQSGSHTALCQTYPGNGSTGTKIFSWTDENSSGDIDLGDTVEVSFSSCWNNNPNNDHDTFYEGKIHFTDYLKAANPGGNSASVLLESFIITETELDNGAYTIDSDSAMTLTGGFDFTLTP